MLTQYGPREGSFPLWPTGRLSSRSKLVSHYLSPSFSTHAHFSTPPDVPKRTTGNGRRRRRRGPCHELCLILPPHSSVFCCAPPLKTCILWPPRRTLFRSGPRADVRASRRRYRGSGGVGGCQNQSDKVHG